MLDALKKVGHNSQLYGVEEYRLTGGRGDGMRLLSVRNGLGLSAVIAADRCLDIYRLEYKGVNIGFFSPAGYCSPKYYDKDDFLRNFTAGFFTTCGLLNAGADCVDEFGTGVTHGRISNTAAENLSCNAVYDGTQPAITISGTMNQGVLFGEKLQLTRHFSIRTDSNVISLTDTITNFGGEKQPLMLLYHVNHGYPLLDADTEIIVPAKKTTPRDAEAAKGVDIWNKFSEPISGYNEQCFYHDLHKKDGHSAVAVYNPNLKTGIQMTIGTDTLKYLTEWKMHGVRDYVLGLEPGTCKVEGRAKMLKDGILQYIEPGQSVETSLEFKILDGDEQANAAKKEIAQL